MYIVTSKQKQIFGGSSELPFFCESLDEICIDDSIERSHRRLIRNNAILICCGCFLQRIVVGGFVENQYQNQIDFSYSGYMICIMLFI